MAHALLAAKDFVLAKTRLSGILAAHERRLLNQAMLADVLDALSKHAGIEAVVLVSDDPGAKLLADKFSTELLSERAAGANGLNEALTAGWDHLADKGVGDILILHGDMPLLQATDVDALIERGSQPAVDVVLGPDSRNDGTNAMFFRAPKRLDLHFGPESFYQHRTDARRHGLNHAVVRRPGIGRDVDTAADLLAVYETSGTRRCGRRTAAVLSRPEISERLQLLQEKGVGCDGARVASNG